MNMNVMYYVYYVMFDVKVCLHGFRKKKKKKRKKTQNKKNEKRSHACCFHAPQHYNLEAAAMSRCHYVYYVRTL